jgi:hypothetical protein
LKVYLLQSSKRLASPSSAMDAAGQFVLTNLPDGEFEVEISFVGYQPFTAKITVSNYNAARTAHLQQPKSQLDEAVVKG